jgi:hypothetical protein
MRAGEVFHLEKVVIFRGPGTKLIITAEFSFVGLGQDAFVKRNTRR